MKQAEITIYTSVKDSSFTTPLLSNQDIVSYMFNRGQAYRQTHSNPTITRIQVAFPMQKVKGGQVEEGQKTKGNQVVFYLSYTNLGSFEEDVITLKNEQQTFQPINIKDEWVTYARFWTTHAAQAFLKGARAQTADLVSVYDMLTTDEFIEEIKKIMEKKP